MTDLPESGRRWIPEAKIRDYLLSQQSNKSRSRHDFFIGFGFAPTQWWLLRDALMQHAVAATVEVARHDRHGTTYRAVGPLLAPDGRTPVVTAFWIVRADDPRPQLTSVVPGGR